MFPILLAQTPAPDPENLSHFVEVALAAITSKNWPLVAALGVVLAVFLVRKFLAPRVPFLGTDRGGAVLVLLTSLGGAFATAFASGAAVSLPLVVQALSVALTAAGGFNLVKKIATSPSSPPPVAEPVKSPLEIVNGGPG